MDRKWIGIGVCLAFAAFVFYGVGWGVGSSSGDEEFKKSLDAMKQVKSFRGVFTATGSGMHSERLWEVDCSRMILHQQSQNQGGGDSGFDMKDDELLVGDVRYIREGDGGWQNTGYAGDRSSAKWHCDRVAQGIDSDLLPDMLTMIRHAISEKGDKKTMNGVQCRVWKFAQRTALAGQGGSICIGVDDHLPYELTMDGGRYTYSDYNRPIEFEAPEAVLQQASAVSGSN